MSGVRYLNQWLPSDPVEAAAYADLIAEMSARGVDVLPLHLPPELLDLRPAAELPVV